MRVIEVLKSSPNRTFEATEDECGCECECRKFISYLQHAVAACFVFVIILGSHSYKGETWEIQHYSSPVSSTTVDDVRTYY